MIEVYLWLEYVLLYYSSNLYFKIDQRNPFGCGKHLHSPSDEEEGTELRFISRCTKMHISYFFRWLNEFTFAWQEFVSGTCFSGDSECPNRSTWIISCSLVLLFPLYSNWRKYHMHLAVIKVLIIWVDRYQLPHNDGMLAKWPGCETNVHWTEKWA